MRAVQLAPDDAWIRATYAFTLYLNRQFEAADAENEKALALAPNHMAVQQTAASQLANAQQWERAEALQRRAMMLDPVAPPIYASNLAYALCHRRKYAEAAALARDSVERSPEGVNNVVTLAAALGQLGKVDEARAAAQELERRSPGFTIAEYVRGRSSYERNSLTLDHVAEGLRKAGVPE